MLQNSSSPKTAGLVVIGNEILSGRTRDANTQYLANALNTCGLRLLEVRIIPDDEARIVSTLTESRDGFDIVFTSGGIGPTHDDITAACVARAFGVALVRHEPSFQALAAHFGVEHFNAARQRMAWLPEGATPIPNAVSVAPGFRIGNVHVLAGVPKIFAAMVDAIVPTLPRGPALAMTRWHAHGLREGDLAAGLQAIQDRFPSLDLGSYPYDRPGPGKGVVLVAKGYDAAQAEQAGQALHALIVTQGQTPIPGEPEG